MKAHTEQQLDKLAKKAMTSSTLESPSMDFKKGLIMKCHTASIPGLTIATTDNDAVYRGLAYQKLYEDITLSFYCSEEMRELEFLQNWMKLMVKPKNNRVGYYNDYIGNIDIIKLDRQQKPVMTTHLIDAYPKGISAMELGYGSNNEVMSVSATFTYRYYTQVFGEKQETVGRGLNQITPVQRKNITAGIIDRTLTQEQRKDIFDGDTVGSNDEFESSE